MLTVRTQNASPAVSQPSRSAAILVASVPSLRRKTRIRRVDLAKKEQLRAEYTEMYPLHKVPLLRVEDGHLEGGPMIVPESHAIMRFLCTDRRNQVPDHFYPSCPRRRAQCDAVMQVLMRI